MLPQQWWIRCNAKASYYHNNDELDAILKHHVTIIMMNYDAILKHLTIIMMLDATKASCYHNNDELDAILKHHVTIIMMN